MSFFAAIGVALEALFINKGRSMLTSLGIVIGIAAVIAMVAAGGGAREKLDEQLDAVGKNLILLQPGGRTSTGVVTQFVPLTMEDAQALRDDPYLKRLTSGIAESLPVQAIIKSPTHTHRTTLVGNVPAIFQMRRWKLQAGRFFSEADAKKSAMVCLLGDSARKKLFPNKQNPVGERIRVENYTLEVIGALEPKGKTPTGNDQDDQVFVPISTLQEKLAQGRKIALIVASVRYQENIAPAVARITKIMRDRHHLQPGMSEDFSVSSIEEMASLAYVVTNTLNVLVVVIASISLIVGGIGIMNIMLVSVTERTREIGIRMAVGATPANVRNQFLLESVALSLVGGLIGVTLGILAAIAITRALDWPIYLSPFYISMAFGVSAVIGVFFGYYPAAKASQLDPIDALRYE
jgi:putative ABC transport system permease protein